MQHPPFTALAAVYDTMMDDVEYSHWADFVLSYARDEGLTGHKALDLACGTGGFTQELFTQGWQVTGLDGSPEMLAAARARLPEQVQLERGDLRTFSLGVRFDLITCVFDSLNNLLTPEDLGAAFAQAYKHLEVSGLLACDLNTRLGVRDLWDGGVMEGVAPAGDGSEVHYHWLHTYDAEAELGIVQATCRTVRAGGEVDEFMEIHRERGYDPGDIAPLLRAAGFSRFDIVQYPDYAAPDENTPRVWVFAWKEAAEQASREQDNEEQPSE